MSLILPLTPFGLKALGGKMSIKCHRQYNYGSTLTPLNCPRFTKNNYGYYLTVE